MILLVTSSESELISIAFSRSWYKTLSDLILEQPLPTKRPVDNAVTLPPLIVIKEHPEANPYPAPPADDTVQLRNRTLLTPPTFELLAVPPINILRFPPGISKWQPSNTSPCTFSFAWIQAALLSVDSNLQSRKAIASTAVKLSQILMAWFVVLICKLLNRPRANPSSPGPLE